VLNAKEDREGQLRIPVSWSLKAVRDALTAGVDINALDPEGRTALIWVAAQDKIFGRPALRFGARPPFMDHHGLARKILAAGAEVDRRDPQGRTTLMWAAASAQLEIIQMVIRAGADPTLEDAEGRSCLDHASDHLTRVIRAFLQAGVRPAPRPDWHHVLHRAVRQGRTTLVRLLLEEGLSPRFKSCTGESLAVETVRSHRAEFLGLLLPFGFTPEELLEIFWDLIRLDPMVLDSAIPPLVEAGLDLEARDAHGRTPLMAAALVRRPYSVKVLLQAGADADAKDRSGMTARQLLEARHPEAGRPSDVQDILRLLNAE
jgi:ankyrin repeat protein